MLSEELEACVDNLDQLLGVVLSVEVYRGALGEQSHIGGPHPRFLLQCRRDFDSSAGRECLAALTVIRMHLAHDGAHRVEPDQAKYQRYSRADDAGEYEAVGDGLWMEKVDRLSGRQRHDAGILVDAELDHDDHNAVEDALSCPLLWNACVCASKA